MKSKFIRILLLIGVPLVAIAICFYYMTLIPDFDIGFYGAFTSLACMAFTLIATIVAVVQLYKFTKPGKYDARKCIFVIALYWVFVWGFCYFKCVVEAGYELEQFLNGYH